MTTVAAPSGTVAAPSPRSRLVRRFSAAERLLHWLFTLDVTLLVVSGLGLYLPPPQNPVLEKRALMHTIHIDAAVGMIFLPLVFVLLRPAPMLRLWRDVEWFDADDWRWLRRVWTSSRHDVRRS